MWIIPKNISDTCPSVADTKGLDLDSEEFSQMCEKSLMLKSKPSLSPTWLLRWKRLKWMQHLCSRTLKNSHSESFVDAWTSCLEDSHVSPLVEQENNSQLKTPVTSSPTSLKESESASQQLSFSKMLRELSAPKQKTENQFSSMCSKAWKKWVTEQRQEYSQRLKLELPIKGSESLSWPTARTSDAEGGRIKTELTDKGFRSLRAKSNQWFGAKLRDAVETYENWATPNTMDWMPPRSEEALRRQANTTRKGRTKPANLREQVNPRALEIYTEERQKNWPTPTASDHKGSGPTVIRKDGKDRSMGRLDYATERAGPPDQEKNSTSGKNQESWGTPSASDYKGHPGKNSQQKRITKQVSNPNRLSPNWVEQLMGIPVGWTQLPIEWID